MFSVYDKIDLISGDLREAKEKEMQGPSLKYMEQLKRRLIMEKDRAKEFQAMVNIEKSQGQQLFNDVDLNYYHPQYRERGTQENPNTLPEVTQKLTQETQKLEERLKERFGIG